MYIETVPNRNSPAAILLRQGWREGGKTRKRTLANLLHWPKPKIETLRRLLRDETLVSPQDLFTTRRTVPHGHVEALLAMMRKLGLESVIACQRSREWDLVVAMIVQRLMACHNPLWEEERRRKREALLDATEKSLAKIAKEVARRKNKPLQAAEIGVKVGKVLGRYKVGKHFECTIGEGRFGWSRRQDSIEQEAKLYGIYVLRTSEPAERLSAADTVRSYKSLAEVERAFRCLKGVDLRVWPIRHRTEDRVLAHIFLCLLACYGKWHLRRAWAPLLFEDEQRPEERKRRDPILPAKASASAQAKKRSHETADGFPVHSFQTLLSALASRAKVTYELRREDSNLTFRQVPEPTPLQARAYELIRTFPVSGN